MRYTNRRLLYFTFTAIRVGFGVEVAKTPTYPLLLQYDIVITIHQRYRQTDGETDGQTDVMLVA